MQNVSDLFGRKMKRREKVVAPAGRLGVRQLAAALEFRVSRSKLDENSKLETGNREKRQQAAALRRLRLQSITQTDPLGHA
jgi:hypothetical protein